MLAYHHASTRAGTLGRFVLTTYHYLTLSYNIHYLTVVDCRPERGLSQQRLAHCTRQRCRFPNSFELQPISSKGGGLEQ